MSHLMRTQSDIQQSDLDLEINNNQSLQLYSNAMYNIKVMKDTFDKLNNLIQILHNIIQNMNSKLPIQNQSVITLTIQSIIYLMKSMGKLFQIRIKNNRQFNNTLKVLGQLTGQIKTQNSGSLTQQQKLYLQNTMQQYRLSVKQQMAGLLKEIVNNEKKNKSKHKKQIK